MSLGQASSILNADVAELVDAQDLKSCGWINRAGSIPAICTNDVSVRTNRTDRYKNQSENKSGWFFCCLKTILKSSKRKDGVSSEDNKERTIIWGMSKTKAWIYMWIC